MEYDNHVGSSRPSESHSSCGHLPRDDAVTGSQTSSRGVSGAARRRGGTHLNSLRSALTASFAFASFSAARSHTSSTSDQSSLAVAVRYPARRQRSPANSTRDAPIILVSSAWPSSSRRRAPVHIACGWHSSRVSHLQHCHSPLSHNSHSWVCPILSITASPITPIGHTFI